MRKTAAHVAHEGLGKFHEAQGDAAAVHDFASEHKERQRHKREAVHAVIKVAVKARDDVAPVAFEHDECHGGCKQAKDDGQANHDEQQEKWKEPK